MFSLLNNLIGGGNYTLRLRLIEEALADLTAMLFWTGKFSVGSFVTKCLTFLSIAANVDLWHKYSPRYVLYDGKAVVAETTLRLQVSCSPFLTSNVVPITDHHKI